MKHFIKARELTDLFGCWRWCQPVVIFRVGVCGRPVDSHPAGVHVLSQPEYVTGLQLNGWKVPLFEEIVALHNSQLNRRSSYVGHVIVG